MLDFTDDFDSFDTNRWTKGSHNLARSYLDPGNVGASNGNLEIKLAAHTLEGGEIVSNDLYGYGSYSARIKVPHAPSSITGFFLYQPPDYASELDVEIYNDSSRKMVIYGTYAGGAQTYSETMRLPLDLTTGFHEYRFDYAPDSVKFYVDGQLMKEWTYGIPQSSMKLSTSTPGTRAGSKARGRAPTQARSGGLAPARPAVASCGEDDGDGLQKPSPIFRGCVRIPISPFRAS